MVLGDVGERAPVAGQREPRAERLGRCRARSGTRRPGRACSRSRSRARRGRAGGRRRSAAAARAGTGTTCEGAWPGVSCTDQVPRSVSTSTPGQQVAVGLERAGGERAAASRGGSRGTPLWRAISTRRGVRGLGVVGVRVEVRRGWGAPTPRSPRARRSGAPGRSGRRGRGCRPRSRTCSSRRPTWSSARSRWPSEPGSCVPVSTSTIPSPAAIAQALQCGTPGHGSGRRSRQTPGSTRSPRPTSRGRVGLRMGRDGNCPGMATSAQSTRRKAVMTAYFEALARHDLDAIAAAWAPDGRLPHRRRRSRRRARRRARLLGRVLRQPARLPLRGRRTWSPTATRWPCTGPAAGTFAGPGSLQGIEPTFARLDLDGLDLFTLRDGQIVREHAYTDGTDLRAPDRAAAAARLDRRAAHDARVQRPGQAQAARGLRRRRSGSPRASGSSAAASR